MDGLEANHASPGMANENYGASMRRYDAPGYGNIIHERYRRILNYADVVTVLLEDLINFFPTRAIHEPAVNEHDVIYPFRCHMIFFF